jgi:hypothetical protein
MVCKPTVAASLLALAALIATPAAFAACTYPHAPPPFPDGNTASMEEMLTAKKSVQQYMGDMDAYIKCIDEESPPGPPTAQLTEAQKKEQDARERVRAQKHNAAVADEEAVAERFNVQLRAYKAKSAKG